MVERTAASILWFHPMAWWLLERIHLAREQAVDLEVAGLGQERDQYLQSLLNSAGLANPPAFPASSFVRRPSHLVARVAFLTKETTMSIRATVASAAMTTVLTGAALFLAGFYLPLQLTAQPPFVSPTSLRIKRPSAKVEGSVLVDTTFNSDGEVIDARVVSGPEELRGAALKAVVSMSVMKENISRRVIPVTIDFEKNAKISSPPPPPPPPPVDQAEFEGIDYQGLPSAIQQRASLLFSGLQSRQHLTNAQIDDYRAKLAAIDPTLRLGISMKGTQPPSLRLLVHNRAVQSSHLPIEPGAMQANLLSKIEPVYPPLAQQARIQGTVRFNIVVGKDGSVEQMVVVQGHPLLIPAAQEAVKQYKYRPVKMNGQPAAVQTTVDVSFNL